jgi:hypothetical protein
MTITNDLLELGMGMLKLTWRWIVILVSDIVCKSTITTMLTKRNFEVISSNFNVDGIDT